MKTVFSLALLCFYVYFDRSLATFNIGQLISPIQELISKPASPLFNSLAATWHYLDGGFDKLPRTIKEAIAQGFTLKDDQCEIIKKHGPGSTQFVGKRYWKNEDPAMILLYDKQGTIAGMQSSGNETDAFPEQGWRGRYFLQENGTQYWTQTVYFINPSVICEQGRSKGKLKGQGTRVSFYVQKGPNPVVDLYTVPLDIEQAEQKGWNFGTCYQTMGIHHSYQVSSKMSCGDYVPTTILYNNGTLTGFVLIKNALFDSTFYDVPGSNVFTYNVTLRPVPDCFYTEPSWYNISTIHVYFNQNPRSTSNC